MNTLNAIGPATGPGIRERLAARAAETAAADATRAERERMTAAYVAMGAANYLRRLPDIRRDDLVSRYGGELHLIRELVAFVPELESHAAELEARDDWAGVFPYDVAEPFGKLAAQLMAHDAPIYVARIVADLTDGLLTAGETAQ
ncbi:MAG: hypothetical protein ACXIUZ_02090 [Lysobacteraceae bacterium]